MSTLLKNELAKDATEKPKPFAPKRFVFDVPSEPQSRVSLPNRISQTSDDFQLQTFLPIILEFPHPNDYKEAYQSITTYILNVFSEVRELAMIDDIKTVKKIAYDLDFEDPKNCIKFLREIIIDLFDKKKKLEKGDHEKVIKQYEKLLQKSELKVRDLIRNEQIYRISFDQYTMRHDESERTISSLQKEIEEKIAVIETLTQKTTKLMTMLHHKDEEIRSLLTENHGYIQNCPTTPNHNVSRPESTNLPEHHRAKLKSLNLQNLKIVLSTKATPSESSRLTPSLESARALNNLKKNPSMKSPIVKPKSVERPGKSIGPINIGPLKLQGTEKSKDVRDDLKNRIEVLTERRKFEKSGEFPANTSERRLDGFHTGPRGSPKKTVWQTNLYKELNKHKEKESPRLTTRKEHSKGDKSKSILSVKIIPCEEAATHTMKTEPGEDMSTVIVEKKSPMKKMYETDKVVHSKTEVSQFPSFYKRNTGISKTRPMMTEESQEKSSELKTVVFKNKQLGYSTLSFRSVPKEKSPKIELKDNKSPQSNTVFMNIMLKKLANQKSGSKKTL